MANVIYGDDSFNENTSPKSSDRILTRNGSGDVERLDLRKLSVFSGIDRSGQKWAIFGDSFANTLTDQDYPYYVAQELGMDMSNVVTHAGSGYRIFETNSDLNALPSGYFDDIDLVTLHIGLNDSFTHIAPGSIDQAASDSASEFIPQYKYFIETVLTANPAIELYLITPTKTWGTYSYEVSNNVGYYTKDYAQAIKDIAQLYSLQVIDLYNNSMLNDLNHSIYSDDGVHPNAVYRPILGRIIANCLKSYGNNYETSEEAVDYGSIFNAGKNLFDKDSASLDKYQGADGYIGVSSSYVLSDYIAVTPGVTYTFNFGVRFTTYFDLSKTVVAGGSSSALSSSDSITIPDGVYFVRLSLYSENIDDFQFEVGSTSTAFEAYREPVSIPFDNSGTGLTSTTMQDAIIELLARIQTLENS